MEANISLLSANREFGRGGHALTAALAVPLLLVVLAAGFAATPDQYRPASLTRWILGYPIRIDLVEVQRVTASQDLADMQADRALQEEEEAALSLNVREETLALQRDSRLGEDFLDGIGEPRTESARIADNSAQGYALGDGPFMPLDFDLAGSTDARNTLQVRKSVQLGDAVLGQVQVRIDDTAAVYVARKDVFALLPDTPRAAQSLKDEYVRLSALREVGINLRYDATGDRFVLAQ